MSENILKNVKYKCAVSSVLNRDVKQYGKSFMFDGEEDTSWSSDQGTPQFIAIQFEEPQTVKGFSFQFQGGFAGKDGTLKIENGDSVCIFEESFYPDDINAVQQFPLSKVIHNVIKLKFTFEASTDFFGRIIVYNLEIF